MNNPLIALIPIVAVVAVVLCWQNTTSQANDMLQNTPHCEGKYSMDRKGHFTCYPENRGRAS